MAIDVTDATFESDVLVRSNSAAVVVDVRPAVSGMYIFVFVAPT